jgi:uncharacterized protein YjbI with pentapeptide repeats
MRCLNWRTNVRNKPFEGLASTAALSAALLWTMPLQAAGHLTAEQVRAAVSDMPNDKVDLSNKDMSGDDLTGLDLSGANLTHADLSGADLHGVKLVGADLTEADLTKADLTGTWIMKANFNRAKLHGATLQVVITSEAMDNQRETAASFVGADLSYTFATVHFSYDDMRGANFTGTRMSVVLANQSMGILRSEFKGANLDGANFTDAGLGHITFEFAKLNDANFSGADLTRADFTGADLTNADFTGAKLDHTTFEQATLRGVTGLAEAGGPK